MRRICSVKERLSFLGSVMEHPGQREGPLGFVMGPFGGICNKLVVSGAYVRALLFTASRRVKAISLSLNEPDSEARAPPGTSVDGRWR